jgi:hypothetical protein
MTQELWARLGHAGFLLDAPWPHADPALAISNDVTLVVQVNGKVRGKLSVARGASEMRGDGPGARGRAHPSWFEGREITRTVFVPGPPPERGRALTGMPRTGRREAGGAGREGERRAAVLFAVLASAAAATRSSERARRSRTTSASSSSRRSKT